MAVAAMMLLVVFLAVPALQRNARNSQRRHDAEFIASQRVQYNLDNQTAIIAGGFNCDPPITTKLFCGYISGSLSYYDLSNVTFHNSGTTPPGTVPAVSDLDHIISDTFFNCDPSGSTAVVSTNMRNMIVLFAIETGSGLAPQCIESSIYPTS